jgi:ATP phosphoribosyltransferase regulatory subunit
MSTRFVGAIPRGFRDILPREAILRERLSRRVQQVFDAWGYDPVETPTLELADVLERSAPLPASSFKLFDGDGATLVLRPDVTLPIARLVATRSLFSSLDASAGDETAADQQFVSTLRLRYRQTVFREESSLQAAARTLTQIGVECIGRSDGVLDAELLLLLAEALDACTLKDYAIALCTVSVLRSLLADCVQSKAVDADWEQAMLAACHASDLVAVDELAAHSGLEPRYGRALSALIRLRGGFDAISECRRLVEGLTSNSGLDTGLDNLEQSYRIATEAAPDVRFIVDFSVMSSFDYYTGLVFAAYAPGVGTPLALGGRYDNTLTSFGRSAPAAGFACNLERIVATLTAAGSIDVELAKTQSVEAVLCDRADPLVAFTTARELRQAGQRAAVETEAKQG